MEERRLGRTGHVGSVVAFGGAVLWSADQEEAGRLFQAYLDAGGDHVDIAPQYGNAQAALGPHLPAVRHRLFLGTKSLRKSGDGFRAQLEETLTLLGTDHTDLHQLHAVTSLDVLAEREAGGAVAALLKARDEGLTRFVGITGHDLGTPRAQLEAVRRYDLDTVMLPVNPRFWADAQYRADAEALLEVCVERDLGVHAIKAAAARPWTDGEQHVPWYEPYTTAEEVGRGVRFALSTPGVHRICAASDPDVLRTTLHVLAQGTQPMTGVERTAAIDAVAKEPLISLGG